LVNATLIVSCASGLATFLDLSLASGDERILVLRNPVDSNRNHATDQQND